MKFMKQMYTMGYYSSTSTTNYRTYTSYEECSTASSYKYNCTKIHGAGDSMWRIIGIMNNIEGEDGNIGSYIKIIKDPFDTKLSWDSSSTGINYGYGVNEWSEADIEKVLNDEYLYRRTGSNLCYRSSNNTIETCPDWPTIGISEEARNMIASVKWNTGTMPIKYDGNEKLITASYMYEAERSDHNGKEVCSGGTYCNDKIDRTTTWTGKVGLMYLSDYGYAIGTEVRETCLGKSMYSYNSDSCMTNDWLYVPGSDEWTITPVPASTSATGVFHVTSSGYVITYYASYTSAIRPTVYLKGDVKIKPNDDPTYGEVSNPFVLEYNEN